jgi:hypothetical protein
VRFYRKVHTRSGVAKFVVETLGVSPSLSASPEQVRSLLRYFDRSLYSYAAMAVDDWMAREAAIVQSGRSLNSLSEYEQEKRRLAFSRYAGCMNVVEKLSGKWLK